MSVDSARLLLNAMAEESQRKLDLETVKCADAHEKQQAMTEGARQDISDYNAQAAAARARVLGTQTSISGLQDKLPRLIEALKLHKSKCEDDQGALRAQIQLVLKDVGTLDKVAKMTKCDISLGTTTTLLQCQRHSTRGLAGGTSFITFGHRVLRRKAAQLRTHTAKVALQKALLEVAQGAHGVAGAGAGALRRHVRAHQQHTSAQGASSRGRRRLRTLARGRRMVVPRRRRLAGARGRPGAPGHGRRLAALVQHRANATFHTRDLHTQFPKPARKCAIRTTPTCDTLSDKFLVMQTGIADKLDGMQESLSKVAAMCKATESNYQAQIEELETRLQDQQTALAEATKVVIDAEEQSRLTGQSLDRLQQEAQRTAEQCEANLRGLDAEICSVRQIRQELYKMEAQRPFIQDCQVSPWMPEECSASCDGGTQRLVRAVVVPASLGAACPPLVMQRRCNEQPCPVDCVLEDWGGWSACSARCGGGIMERVRSVRVQASGGGRPCASTSESRSCGTQACDQDCKLTGWTRWSSCSKACDGGFQMRARKVAERAKGAGTCPEPDAPSRRQYHRCNEGKCTPKNGDTLRCTAIIDVVLVIDGSASIGTAGWEAAKSAAAALLKAFKTGADGAQVAVLLYSGPKSWSDYQKCTGGAGTVDLLKDCNLIWVSHFTTQTDQLAANLPSLKWPMASTLTSAALATVEAELPTGRANAQTVVIAITDGKAMNPRKTLQAAISLRMKARLIWVPITRMANLVGIKAWASRPVADNVIVVEDEATLSSPVNLNRIIAAACPQVE